MYDPNLPDNRTKTEQILDLLLDALLERQSARRRAAEAARAQSAPPTAPATRPSVPSEPSQPIATPAAAETRRPTPARQRITRQPEPDQVGWEPAATVPGIGLRGIVWRLLVFVAAMAILINVPFNRHGVSLARMLPDSEAFVIREGLVVKASGDEIYQLQDDKLRWISSMTAFEALGLTWDDVHLVEDAFLNRFERGEPIHVLVGCAHSPHIYLLEGPVKRWIKDIPTFEMQRYRWEAIHWIDCDELRAIPDGPPIPEDAGPPPQP
mgnify:CR=1 FL=1